MTTVSKNAAPVKTHRSKAKAEATRRGLLYALPDWLMIIMLFFVPIVLLVIMAGSRWSLMGGNRGWNFPENFVKVFENKLLGQSVLFTLEYTVIVTIFLLVLGLGLALIVQESTKWNICCARASCCRPQPVSPPLRCCSTRCTPRRWAPSPRS
ncbi:hypothetical protein [Bifidobacterium adolescentis]|uniref:hypothetical protein n=1 Tax=Bifidobacterium adolescentis TaxID=1680 RepID=UPI0022E3998D|nr:hypothetical protein [Bifidobacterium adolescentis]